VEDLEEVAHEVEPRARDRLVVAARLGLGRAVRGVQPLDRRAEARGGLVRAEAASDVEGDDEVRLVRPLLARERRLVDAADELADLARRAIARWRGGGASRRAVARFLELAAHGSSSLFERPGRATRTRLSRSRR